MATTPAGASPAAGTSDVWPLSQAAQACFGTPQWPAGTGWPPQGINRVSKWEDADAVAAAGGEPSCGAGFELLHPARTEAVGTDGDQASHRGWPDRRHLIHSHVSTTKSLPETPGRGPREIAAKSHNTCRNG